MDDVRVPLLDLSGQWTHRQRHHHHRFEIQVPDGTVELRIRFRWQPVDLGSEHEANSIAMSLFGPEGFRGAAPGGTPGDQQVRIGEAVASPGSIPGPISPGTWSINVDTGEILNDGVDTGHFTYRLEATATIGDRRDPAKSPSSFAPSASAVRDPSGARWYRGDLHAHTVHSDGTITIEDRVRGAVAKGMDFLAITDHNTISHHRELGRWPDGIIPIRASEVTTFNGHMNAFGLATLIDWRDDARGSGAASIVDQAHRQNALISINHPNAFGNPWCSGCHWDYALVDFTTIDAIEVWNGRWRMPESDNNGALAFWTDLLDAGFRPTAVSGTDSHSAEEDEYVALPMNYVYADDQSEGAILDGIRQGRVFLSSGPTVSFHATGPNGVEVSLPGTVVPAHGAFSLTVDVERLDEHATLWCVTSGSMAALAECGPPGAHVTSDNVEANAWWRLELRQGTAATEDIIALTNPVYVATG